MLPLFLGIGAGLFASKLFNSGQSSKAAAAQQEYYKKSTALLADQRKREAEAQKMIEGKTVKPGGRQRAKGAGGSILGSPYIPQNDFLFSL